MPRYWNSFSQGWRDSDTELGYPYVAEDAMASGEGQTELAAKTADAIMADVGTDAALAQEALDAEQAREKPRVSLVAKLQKVIEAADAAGTSASD